MRLGILFSGGKDSNYVAWLAKKTGYNIECLISIKSINKESFMFHTPAIDFVEKQAESMGIPVIIQETLGNKEEELEDLRRAIRKAVKKYNIEGIVTGAVESVYQASRVQLICNELGIECFNPLWQKNPLSLWEELIKNKFEAVIVGVSAEGLGKDLLGRKIDEKALVKLIQLSKNYNFHLAFEGGEAETFVLDCPLYKKKLVIKDYDLNWTGNSGEIIIKKLDLVKK